MKNETINKIVEQVKNSMASNGTTEKKVWLKPGAGKAITFLLLPIALLIVMATAVNIVSAVAGSALDQAQAKYETDYKTAVQKIDDAKKAVAAVCADEPDLAKKKLAAHFSDEKKLDDATVAKLNSKAVGESLDCQSLGF